MIGSWFTRRNKRRLPRVGRATRRAPLGAALLAALGVGVARAQVEVRWTTNYYRVTGSTLREVRQSINRSRPWRDRSQVDASTAWNVTWKYGFASTPQGCQPESVRAATVVTTTLPLYVPPTNAAPELKQRWAGYFKALAAHEARHAAIATRAAEEVQRSLAAIGTRANCPTLQADLNALGESLLARFRQEEREMDRASQHGIVDGAHFP